MISCRAKEFSTEAAVAWLALPACAPRALHTSGRRSRGCVCARRRGFDAWVPVPYLSTVSDAAGAALAFHYQGAPAPACSEYLLMGPPGAGRVR